MQAVKALGSITSKDIGSLKALKNPPDIVKRIFDCVLLLRMYPLDKPQWQEVKGAQVRAHCPAPLIARVCTSMLCSLHDCAHDAVKTLCTAPPVWL